MKKLPSDGSASFRVYQLQQVSTSVQAQMWRLRKRAIWGSWTPHYPVHALAAWATPSSTRFAGLMTKGGAVIAEQDGVLWGYAMLDMSNGEIESLFVEPLYQGRGVGQALMRSLDEMAASHGVQYLFAYASLNARRFFQRAGFTFEREQDHEHHSGATLRVAFMAKALR
ncbi:GNAT family N-acetyltransferase [Massilia sp. IC2-477]|uniref:GNAT family N-acetyltransferase n=1 Tax=unclassified Massilia TaxID=2609279 RepID=UPI001D1102CC|nr:MULTISPECIES: GNAT family N-acetyltransferase [unclassified Massilia]MCC2958712.1 GNAT family N-acetyltransferase [Massilia sp. IC2-477]MCC2971412.1 GNAT family N-acetyltransferase [Massilia sp. IC2-476]